MRTAGEITITASVECDSVRVHYASSAICSFCTNSSKRTNHRYDFTRTDCCCCCHGAAGMTVSTSLAPMTHGAPSDLNVRQLLARTVAIRNGAILLGEFSFLLLVGVGVPRVTTEMSS